MSPKQKPSLKTMLLPALLMAALVGCSSEPSSSAPSSNASNSAAGGSANTAAAASTDPAAAASTETAAQYPIVIKHALGETVIEKKPERVATIQWANHDVALALGVVPVGFSAANYGVQDDSGLLPWTAAKLKELGVDKPNIFQDTDGLDFEAISDSNPDVILAAYSGITKEDYELLSKIAPVVPYQTAPWVTTWREQVLYDAMGMGMQAEGEQLIKDTESLIKEKAAQYPDIQGKKVAFANFSADDLSKIYIYTPTDPRGEFLLELGMVYPDSILNKITDKSSFSLDISAENADILNDADIIVAYGDDSLYQTLKSDKLLGKIPAIQRGSVVFIGNGTPLAAAGNPNPLAIQYTIDDYLKLIGEAAAKIDG